MFTNCARDFETFEGTSNGCKRVWAEQPGGGTLCLHIGKVWVSGEELNAIHRFVAPDEDIGVPASLRHMDERCLDEETALLAAIELTVLGTGTEGAIWCRSDGIVREAEEERGCCFDDGFKGPQPAYPVCSWKPSTEA